MLVAPNDTKLSDTLPNSGFAVIPENASDPPHLRPIFNLDICTSSLSNFDE